MSHLYNGIPYTGKKVLFMGTGETRSYFHPMDYNITLRDREASEMETIRLQNSHNCARDILGTITWTIYFCSTEEYKIST